MSKSGHPYFDQLDDMLKNAVTWKRANPDTFVEVRFNFPPDAMLISPISHALGAGLVSANAAGLELIKALWPWDVETEPTVLMVRTVIECPPPLPDTDFNLIPTQRKGS